MIRLLLGVALLVCGVTLLIALSRLFRRRVVPTVSTRWLMEHAYDKDGDQS